MDGGDGAGSWVDRLGLWRNSNILYSHRMEKSRCRLAEPR